MQEDLIAVNASIETIRKTRGGVWPEEELNEEFNLLDLAWHEREFRDADSFAYAVRDTGDTYLGCFYLYPMGVRTELTEQLMGYDVDASCWVTTTAYSDGYYQKLYQALQQWLREDFPFDSIFYSNAEMPRA